MVYCSKMRKINNGQNKNKIVFEAIWPNQTCKFNGVRRKMNEINKTNDDETFY